MFGSLLLVFPHSLFQRRVGGFVFSARVRACDGPVLEFRPGDAHQHFRRRSEHVHGGYADPFVAWFLRAAGFFPGKALPAESQEKHIGRWIHRPQRAVEIERSDSGLEIPALRKHYLENISGGDVLLGAPDAFEELRLGRARSHRQLRLRSSFAPVCRLPSRGQLLFNARDIFHGTLVGNSRTFLRDVRRRHYMDLVPQVIEGEHPIEKHQDTIGNIEVIGGVLSDLLEATHHVIGAIADGAGGERRQAFHCRWAMLLQEFLDYSENISRAPLDFLSAATFDHDLFAARLQPQKRTHAEKGIASNFFSAFHRLQQEGIGLSVGYG